MTTAYTSLLGLALPVTGELSGTWGSTVNTAITALLDTAVAGTTSITVDADTTLTTTTGASNEARQAIILWNPAAGTTTRNITAPAQSKMYTVINASGGTQSIVLRGAGPTTGVTILKGESALVAWNGSDFVKVSTVGGAGTFTNLTVTGNTILGDAIGDTLTVNATTSFTAPVQLPSTGRSAAAALTPTNPAFLYGVASTYTDTTSSGTLAPVATFYSLARPTLSTSNVTTYTTAATLYIANAPTTGGSATITNPYSLYVAAGAVNLGGNTAVGGTLSATGNISRLETTNAQSLIAVENTFVNQTAALKTKTSVQEWRIGGNIAESSSTSLEFYDVTAAALRGKFTSTGLAVTGTLSATGTVSSSSTSGYMFLASGSSTSSKYAAIANTSGTMIVGVESSAGGSIITGSSAYDSALTGKTGIAFSANDGSGMQMRLSSTGLAVTGTLTVNGGASDVVSYFNSTSANGAHIRIQSSGVDKAYMGCAPGFLGSGTADDLGIRAVGSVLFATNGSTVDMTLDSSGNLGIGTTTGSARLNVNGGASTSQIRFEVNNATFTNEVSTNAAANAYVYKSNDASYHVWLASSSEKMRLDSSGNLGIGVTPSAWSGFTVLEIPNGGSIGTYSTSSVLYLNSNAYFNGANWIYKTTAPATRYQVNGNVGTHDWFNAPSGTAGNPITFTQAMTLDASGNLLVGTTSRVSLERFTSVTTGDSQAAAFKNDSATRDTQVVWNAATSGNNSFATFYTETSITSRGGISYNRGAGLVVYATTSDYRAKDINGPVTDSGALIDSVPVYMGKMKGATQERPMFVAHETPAYAHTGEKDAVDADGNPVYQQMDAGALIPVMWAEIQSLRKRLTALEST